MLAQEPNSLLRAYPQLSFFTAKLYMSQSVIYFNPEQTLGFKFSEGVLTSLDDQPVSYRPMFLNDRYMAVSKTGIALPLIEDPEGLVVDMDYLEEDDSLLYYYDGADLIAIEAEKIDEIAGIWMDSGLEDIVLAKPSDEPQPLVIPQPQQAEAEEEEEELLEPAAPARDEQEEEEQDFDWEYLVGEAPVEEADDEVGDIIELVEEQAKIELGVGRDLVEAERRMRDQQLQVFNAFFNQFGDIELPQSLVLQEKHFKSLVTLLERHEPGGEPQWTMPPWVTPIVGAKRFESIELLTSTNLNPFQPQLDQKLDTTLLSRNNRPGSCFSSTVPVIVSNYRKSQFPLFHLPGPSYQMQLKYDHLAYDKLKRRTLKGVVAARIKMAREPDSIVGIECVVQRAAPKVNVRGLVVMGLRHLHDSASARFARQHRLLRAGPVNKLSEFKYRPTQQNLVVSVDKDEFDNFQQIADRLSLSYQDLAHFRSQVANLDQVYQLGQLAGLRPDQLTKKDLASFKFPSHTGPEHYQARRRELSQVFAQIKELTIPIYHWMLNQERFKSVAVKDALPTWLALPLEERRSMMDRRLRCHSRIDADQFNQTVSRIYDQKYPYAYSVLDTDVTRLSWLRKQPDGGDLYFYTIQMEQADRSEQVRADLAQARDNLAQLQADLARESAPIRLNSMEFLAIHEDQIWVRQSYGLYQTRNSFLLSTAIQRQQSVVTRLEQWLSLQPTLARETEQAKLRLDAAIVNNTVVRAIETIPASTSFRQSRLIKALNNLDLEDSLQLQIYLDTLERHPDIYLRPTDRQYVEVDTGNWVVCQHTVEFLKTNDLPQIIEQFGQEQANGDRICRHCKSILDPEMDEFFGMVNGQLNVSRDIMDLEGDIYQNQPEVVVSLLAISSRIAILNKIYDFAQPTQLYLAETVTRELGEAYGDAALDPVGHYVLFSQAQVSVGEIKTKTGLKPQAIKNIFQSVGVLIRSQSTKIDQSKLTILRALLYTKWTLVRLSYVLAHLAVTLKLTYRLKLSPRDLVLNTIEQLELSSSTQQILNLAIFTMKKTHGQDAVTNMFAELTEVDISTLLGQVLDQTTSGFVTSLCLERLEEVEQTHRQALSELEFDTKFVRDSEYGLEQFIPNAIGVKLDPSQITDSHALGMARAQQSLAGRLEQEQVLAERLPDLEIWTGGQLMTLREYDAFSKQRVSSIKDAIDCFKAPSLLVYAWLTSGQVVQRQLPPARPDEDYLNYQASLASLEGLSMPLEPASKLEQADVLSRPLITPALFNSSYRIYHIFKTELLPNQGQVSSTGLRALTQTQATVAPTSTTELAEYLISHYLELKTQVDQLLGRYMVGESDLSMAKLLDAVTKPNFTRQEELKRQLANDLTRARELEVFRDSLLFTGFKTADLELITGLTGLELDSGANVDHSSTGVEVPAEATEHKLLTQTCHTPENVQKVRNLYQMFGLAMSLAGHQPDNTAMLTTLGKFLRSNFEFAGDPAIFKSYNQSYQDLMDLSPSQLQDMIGLREVATVNIYSLALKLELLTHLYRIRVDGGIIPAQAPGSETIATVLAELHGRPVDPDLLSVYNLVCQFIATTIEVADPLNQTYYDNLAEREFKMLQGYLRKRIDYDLLQAGLSADILETKAQEDQEAVDSGEVVERIDVGEAAQAQDDDEIEDAYEGVEDGE